MFLRFVIQTRARPAYSEIHNRHMFEGVWCPSNHAGKGSFVTMEICNIANYDGDRGLGIQRVCSIFVDLPVYVEDGIMKHFVSSANVPILRCSVPREMMVAERCCALLVGDQEIETAAFWNIARALYRR